MYWVFLLFDRVWLFRFIYPSQEVEFMKTSECMTHKHALPQTTETTQETRKQKIGVRCFHDNLITFENHAHTYAVKTT